MRIGSLLLGAVAMVATSTLPTMTADARTHHSSRTVHHYKKCRYSKGHTGLIAGAVGLAGLWSARRIPEEAATEAPR